MYFPLQIDFPCNSHISSMGPLSTSDENTSTETSSSSTVSTTAESFMEQRIRHTSMPQARVAASALVPSSSSSTTTTTNSSASNHVHHHVVQPSLSHAEVRNFHGFLDGKRNHGATITSNSAVRIPDFSSKKSTKSRCVNFDLFISRVKLVDFT